MLHSQTEILKPAKKDVQKVFAGSLISNYFRETRIDNAQHQSDLFQLLMLICSYYIQLNIYTYLSCIYIRNDCMLYQF